jgi:hypothetical protein
MLLGTVVNAVHMPPPSVPLLVVPLLLLDGPPLLLLLLPVVPDELLPNPPDELLLPWPPELLPLPPASGKVVDELLEQPARPAVDGTATSAMSPKT